jgi:hypothetical protein
MESCVLDHGRGFARGIPRIRFSVSLQQSSILGILYK